MGERRHRKRRKRRHLSNIVLSVAAGRWCCPYRRSVRSCPRLAMHVSAHGRVVRQTSALLCGFWRLATGKSTYLYRILTFMNGKYVFFIWRYVKIQFSRRLKYLIDGNKSHRIHCYGALYHFTLLAPRCESSFPQCRGTFFLAMIYIYFGYIFCKKIIHANRTANNHHSIQGHVQIVTNDSMSI